MPSNIKHQPIQFELPALRDQDAQFSQLIASADLINFQVKDSTAYTNIQGDEWALTDVTLGGGVFTFNATGATMEYNTAIENGANYAVQLNIQLNGSLVTVRFGTTDVEITSSGTFTVYSASTGTAFYLIASEGTEIVATTINIKKINEGWGLYEADLNGNMISNIQTAEDDLQDENLIYQDCTVPSTDCFRLALAQVEAESLLDDFDTPASWTVEGDGVIALSQFEGTDIRTAQNPHTAAQNFNSGDYSSFRLSFNVGGLTDVTIQVLITDSEGAEVYTGLTYSSVGSKAVEIIYLQKQTDYTLTFEVLAENDTNEFAIDSFELLPYSQIESNVFKLIDDTTGTLLLESTNGEEAFGFHYDNEFTFNLRLSARLQQSQTEDEVEIIRGASGTRNLAFADAIEVEELAIDPAPEYIHRAVRCMRLHDTFTIDGIEYTIWDENYDTRWQNTNLAGGLLQLTLTEDNRVNRLT